MAPCRSSRRAVGALNRTTLFVTGLGFLVAVVGCNGPSSVNNSREVLTRGWDNYKRLYIQSDGRVFDPNRGGGDTTSEGQGYAMLRAAWMRDADTFSRTFGWAEQHLKRSDGLYSWLWTPADGGKVSDPNTASDADQEIALALVIGSSAFSDSRFRDRARELVRAIRVRERVNIGDAWFPAAGNWAVPSRIVNLSYFVPYAYPYFARLDPDGRWESVTETGYDLIVRTLKMPSVRLVPDFMAVTTGGEPAALPEGSGLSGDFSSDAMRIYWRVAVDCQLHKRERACADPLGATELTKMLARDGSLFTRYAVNGTPIERIGSSSFYGAALPFLQLFAPATADAVRRNHLSPSAVDRLLNDPHQYFDANWVWFGVAAADGLIVGAMPND